MQKRKFVMTTSDQNQLINDRTFNINLQQAVLKLLLDKNLLTHSQYKLCTDKLSKNIYSSL